MAQTPTPTTQSALLATFYVRSALFSLDASVVQEVIRPASVTPVRHAPSEVCGVINLRGRIVSLLDTALILGLEKSAPGPESRIFIVEDRNEFVGLLVDRVAEVVEVEPGSEEPVPVNIPAAQARFFRSVFRAGGRLITLLKPGELLAEGRA
jgi:purine-binding chemotaxis protein CheW